jgi:ankyrin repeat protein
MMIDKSFEENQKNISGSASEFVGLSNDEVLDRINKIIEHKDYDDVTRYKKIQNILESRPDVNLNDPQRKDYLPLHFACIYAKTDIVKLLLNNGADVNAKNETSYPPLMSAINATMSSKETTLIEILLEAGADVNYQDNQVPVLWIAAGKRPDLIPLLVVKYKADVKTADSKLSLLHELFYDSCHNKNEDIVIQSMKILIENGADINRGNCNNRSEPPLMSAITYGHGKAAELLLQEYNATIDGNTREGYNVLEEAIKNKNITIIFHLLKKGGDAISGLECYIRNCDCAPEIVETFLKYKANASWGLTQYLMYIATQLSPPKEESQKIIDIFLRYGADATEGLKDYLAKEKFPSEYQEHQKIVDIFIKHGANVTKILTHYIEKMKPNDSLLKHQRTIEILLELGGDATEGLKAYVKKCNSISQELQQQIVDIFIKRGASFNALPTPRVIPRLVDRCVGYFWSHTENPKISTDLASKEKLPSELASQLPEPPKRKQ